jgi:hypothetical protein
MTLWRKRALAGSIIWSVVAAGFVISFLSGDGPSGFIKGNARRNIGAGFLAAGIAAHFIVRHLTRRPRKSERVLVDERDESIMRRASEWAFFILALFVFLFSIGLHDAFRSQGSVPIGWLWFLAYSSWILAHCSQSVAALILYHGKSGRGEG